MSRCIARERICDAICDRVSGSAQALQRQHAFQQDAVDTALKVFGLSLGDEAESPIDRCWRAQRKIEARLTEDGERPTGMRKRTFERLCDEWDALEDRKDELWLPGFLRLARRLGFDPNALL